MGANSKHWKVTGIYKLTCANNGKVYIGKATNIGRRLNDHKNVKKNAKGNCYFQHAILKHGWNSFVVEILETVENFNTIEDNNALLEREAYYIELYKSTDRDKGYNRCKFSSDNTGRVRSEEHKQKLRQPRSDATKERIRQASLGRTISKEHREKISKFHLGRKRSDETKRRMSVSGLGRTHSEESKLKISLAKKGKKHTEEHKEKVRQAKLKKKLQTKYDNNITDSL